MKQIQINVNVEWCFQLLVLVAVWSVASAALAGGVNLGGIGGGGGAMPWDRSVGTLRGSVKGVVCPAMIFIGIVVAAGDMLKNGELAGWGKRGLVTVLAGAMGLGGDALITSMSSGGIVR